ncbi:MAG: hypothetical protein JW861_01320, partial [Bacteroidales bacterium]|nr:hypothetical protein [Bacteroidales bacterium]
MNSLFRFGLPVFMLLLITAHGIRAQQMTGGQVHGNFQVDVQTYDPNPDIGITEEEIGGNKMGSNGFGNFIYTNGDFTAGARFEYYLKPLVGFDPAYEGGGIPYRFASYRKDMFEITVGNFYEQFGNGLIFRSYEEWSLGYDNSVDGIRVRINPIPGISIKGIYGTQRYFWERYEDGNRAIIKGGDAEFFLNEMVGRWKEKETRIILGGSVISKYEKDDPFSLYKYPENVTAFAGRFNLNRGRIHMLGEYAYKINDPSAINHNIYKEGQSIYLSGSYSCKGLGITLSTKWIDNMSFKSRRYETGNALEINFLPPLTKQHSYGLEAMYPYATQPNGEFASQGKVIYTIPKKTKLGGRYGTTIELSYSRVTAIDKRPLNDTTPVGTQGTLGYKAPFFGIGDEMFFDDFNV